jgi:rubrerythrin
MGGEQPEGLTDDLREWVESRADEQGVPPETVLARSVAAYRFLEGESDTLAAAPDVDTDDVASRSRLAELEAELRRVEDDLEQRLSTVDDRVDEGFANYEEVLEHLTDATEDLEGKLPRLARAVVDVRETARELSSAAARRRAAAALKREANRHGETTAACGDCGATVALGLLSAPECPHCAATFDGFEAGRGLFSSPRLTVGSRPALDGETDAVDGPSDLLAPDVEATDGGRPGGADRD